MKTVLLIIERFTNMRQIAISVFLIIAFALSNTMTPIQSTRQYQIKVNNINQVEISVSNYGKYGQNDAGWYGAWWPAGSGHHYIFGAGSWFGTIVDGDTLVTIGYGPHGGESEYVPGLADMSISDPNAIIFTYPEIWPPPQEIFPMAPQKSISHQDFWCVYNDLDETAHIPGDTRPIGLEVYQTVHAWNLSTTQDMIFVRFELKNVSGNRLTNCYFGVCQDNAIGDEIPGNDIISGIVGKWYVIDGESLWVDNLGYQWQEQSEPGWNEFPGVLGVDYLQSPWDLPKDSIPMVDKDNDSIPDYWERDSAWFMLHHPPPDTMYDNDGDGTPDWRDPSQIPQLGMTAFKRFTLNLEPNRDNERYVCLAGYNFKTMVYEPFIDTIPPLPDDQRILQCSGPFELEADSTAIVLIGIMFAQWHDFYLRPDSALVQVDNTCQFIYNMNWLLPGPPAPPTLTCIPGDAQITLVWDNKPEHMSDPYYFVVSDPGNPNLYDPYYVEEDFEGYRIWRSLTGQTGTWERLAACDLYDGITFEEISVDSSDTLRAEDTGIFHSYLDDDVRNGFTYHYAVTSFDHNCVISTYDSIWVIDSFWYAPGSMWVYVNDTLEVTGPHALHFESGQVGVQTAARRDPVNYQLGAYSVMSVSGNPVLADLNVGVVITYPFDVVDDSFYFDFGPIVYDSLSGNPGYSVELVDDAGGVLDSYGMTLAVDVDVIHEFSIQGGLSITAGFNREDILSTVSIFDRIEVAGSYPESLLSPVVMAPNWSYRGNDYEVHWIKAYGSDSVNSAIVIDAMFGDTIPFKNSFADNWCFRSLLETTDTLVYSNVIPFATRRMYICSGMFRLVPSGGLTPGGPRPSLSDVWTVYADTNYRPAPANARVQITSSATTMRTDTTYTLNVKVVPNPYIIHNEWQTSFRQRRLKFINLPADCTIRVFNLNGELVKTLVHHHTFVPAEGQQEVINDAGGDQWWDLLSENRQLIASGIYIYHIQSTVGDQVGKFVVIR